MRGTLLGALLCIFAAAGASAQSSQDAAANLVDRALVEARPMRCAEPTSRLPDEVIAVCRGIDIGRGLLPSTVNRLNYAEDNAFDRALGRSLRNTQSSGNVVTVTFAPQQLSRQEVEVFRDVYPDTKRIIVWLNRIDETGGQIRFCTRGANGQLQGFNLLTELFVLALDMLQRWTLYRPARNYHARVITDPVAGSGPTPVLTIEFIRRTRVRGELTCAWPN